MYTIIAATNRPGSQTLHVAKAYFNLMKAEGLNVKLLDLQEMTGAILHDDMYESSVGLMKQLQDEYLVPAEKFVVVSPEYNGSVPGIFKLLIDASDVKACWYDKKACLVGVAAGRAGNLRGLDHLTNIFSHIHVNVLWNKIPISKIDEMLTSDGEFVHEGTVNLLRKQIYQLIEF